MARLKQHDAVLEGKTSRGRSVRLRPMTEDDWDILARWNSDPEVLYYSEGDYVISYSLEEVQDIYRSVSQNAFCFIIEVDDRPVGDCWLQEMNLKRILRKYPHLDCRRIDIMIGEKSYWGQGIGTEATRLLSEFGFLKEDADMIFCCNVADYNPRAQRAYQNAGYEFLSEIKSPPGAKAEYTYDFAMTRERFFKLYPRTDQTSDDI